MKSIHLSRRARLGAAVALSALLLTACGEKPETLIDSARDYLAKGDRPAAVIQLRNALQQAPDNAQARYLLGMATFEQRDFLSAEKELRRALELGYAEEAVLPSLARAMVETRNAAALVKDYGDRNLQDASAQAAFQTALGDAWLAQRKIDEAKRAYAEALHARPDYAAAQAGQARAIAARGDLIDAERLVDTTLKVNPKSIDALMLRAELLAAQRKFGEAEQAYAQIIEIDPEYHDARRALVAILIASKKYDRAAQEIEITKKAGGHDLKLQYLQALLALRQHRFQDAEDDVLQVLKSAPEHVPSMIIAGAANMNLGAYTAAEDYLTRALDRMPKHWGARELLVKTQMRMGQPERAMETLTPMLQQAADQPEVLALAGEVRLANNDMGGAAEYFERAAKLDKNNASVRARLGQVHFDMGEQERGIEDLEAASAADASNYRADLLLVLNYIRAKDYDKATEALRTLEKKQPDNPVTHNVKGVLYVAKKQPEAGRASFEKAIALQPNYYPALINLARLDIRENKPAVARKRFEDVLTREPNNEQLLLAYAGVLQSTGASRDEVTSTMERAVKSNPASPSAHVALINFYRRAGNREAALAAAHNALAAVPNNTAVLDAAGQALLAGGETEQAITTFNKLVNATPGSPNGHLRLAQAYAMDKKTDSAIASLRKALAIQPALDEARVQIVGMMLGSGRADEALAEARGIQKRQPQNALGYALEGDVHTVRRQWADAESAYRQSLKHGADNTAVFIKLHNVLDQQKKTSDSQALTAQWIKDHPKDVAARNYLAELQLREKDYAGAITHYKAILNVEPRNALVLNNIAWAAAQQNDPQAMAYAQKAHDIAPDNPAILDTFGTLLVNKGDVTRGLPMLERAVKLAPGVPAIRINYAKALIKAGKGEAARSELQQLTSHENAQVKSEAETLLKTL
jgi:putative PEP-CTERM system TPR-repeat lipoprotein